jgi:hypothetical protein
MVPLNLFQLLGLAAIAIAALAVVRAVRRHRLAPGPGALWIALWIAAGVFIARPEWTALAARRLGIARGADLVFYCGILGGMVGFLVVYLRMRRLESQLTQLVRELALARAAAEAKDGASDQP